MSTNDDEIQLMRRTAGGDAAAFRALADRHLARIMTFAYRILNDRAEAQDVAQETFLRLWKEAGRYEPKAQLATWLHRIAHNLCVDRLRARRERPTDFGEDDVAGEDGARGSADPASLLGRKETAHAVERALRSLPERQRAAIALVHFQGLGNVEAAEVLGVGVEALESLLARGRRALRESLLGLQSEEGDRAS